MKPNWIKKIGIVILLLVAPFGIDLIVFGKQLWQERREDVLAATYECYPLKSCMVDFNGDGIPSQIEIIRNRHPVKDEMIIADAGEEILRITYCHVDNTLRTHLAVHGDPGDERLLLFDGCDRQIPNIKAAYEWSGNRLGKVNPSSVDEDILHAMAVHDDHGESGRTARRVNRIILYGCYYLTLSCCVLVMILNQFSRIKGKDV